MSAKLSRRQNAWLLEFVYCDYDEWRLFPTAKAARIFAKKYGLAVERAKWNDI